jgi:hypothetical protein
MGRDSVRPVTPSVEPSARMPTARRTAAIKAVEEGISYELLYFAREALRMLNGVNPLVASVTIEDPGANPVDDIVLAFGPGGHKIGGEIFGAQYIQVKKGGTAADAFSSADLADPKCKWLATDKTKQAFLPRLARRWQLFEADKIAACLTLVTTRRWRQDDPIARHLTEGRVDEDAVFRDRRCSPVLRKWQAATGLTDDQLQTFVGSLCIVDGAESMEALRIDIATLARSLEIGDARVVPQIDAVVRGIFRSKDRTLDRNELIRQLEAAGLPVGRLPSRIVRVAQTVQEPLRGWLPRRPYASAPLDVGAVWGMQTGAFAGVIEGVSAQVVAARLKSAQARLYLELTPVAVPRREWRVLESVSGRIDAKNVTDQLTAESPSIPRGLVVDLVDTRPATLDSLQDIARAMLRDGTDAIVVAVSREVSLVQLALEDVIRALEASGVSAEVLKARPVSSQPVTPAVDGQLLDLDISDLQRHDWTEVEQALASAATNANGEIRSRSLWIAASVDDWLDCWFDAYVIGDGSELLSFSAVPHARSDATVADVALGLLRLGRNESGRRDEVRAALRQLDSLLDRDTRIVVSTWFDGGPAGDASDELFVRAGLSRSVTIDSYAGHALLLQSDLLSRERLADFLRQEPAVRAILGLCTPEEWVNLDLDGALVDDIVDLRFQRPLPKHGG